MKMKSKEPKNHTHNETLSHNFFAFLIIERVKNENFGEHEKWEWKKIMLDIFKISIMKLNVLRDIRDFKKKGRIHDILDKSWIQIFAWVGKIKRMSSMSWIPIFLNHENQN